MELGHEINEGYNRMMRENLEYMRCVINRTSSRRRSLATLCRLVSVDDKKLHQHMPTNNSVSRDAACKCRARAIGMY